MRRPLGILAVFALAGLGPAQQVQLQPGQWAVFQVPVAADEGRLSASFAPVSGDADLYVRYGAPPTLTQYDARSANPGGAEALALTNDTTPRLQTGSYYVGVYAVTSVDGTLTKAAERLPSAKPGLGAHVFSDHVMFRVWAPFASSVHVAGSFNGWSSTLMPLVGEPGGHWSLEVRGPAHGNPYKYVVRNGAQTLWKVDPRARQVNQSNGDGVIFDRTSLPQTRRRFTIGPWNRLVIYEMHVGTFNDAPGGAPGTFDSAIARLDLLQDLGVNAVQLMPVAEFPGDFSWGYNPSHPFAVETAYGGPVGLARFVQAAHTRGIAVLLDLVHNHYGPNDLSLWRFDGWSVGPWGGIYFYNDDRAITPWGNTRPDFGRGEVRQYIRDNQMMWASDYLVDGFRWDSTLNMRRTNGGDLAEGWTLLQWVNDELDRLQPWKINIAEDMQENDWITRPTGSGGAGFDSQWAASFVHPIRTALETPDDNARNMWSVRDAVAKRDNGDSFKRVLYTESHDEVANGRQRVPSAIDPGNPASYWAQKRSTLGAALALTAPGIPMLFQGQEILEDGWFSDTDPVDWGKLAAFAGIRLLYKDLIALRRDLRGISKGLTGQHLNFFHVNDVAKVVAFHRWDQGGSRDDVVVVANFRNQTYTHYRIGLPRGGRWSVSFNSDWNGYSPLFRNTYSPPVDAVAGSYDGLNFSGTVNLAPYTALILTKD
jgi:1,4-alpha-glucan branching enzyme